MRRNKQYWCVNFMDCDLLTFGVNERLWLMGYQYDQQTDSAQWKGLCTANWRRLEEISIGDEFVAYVPRARCDLSPRERGHALFATGRVQDPRRPWKAGDARDTIKHYLSMSKLYKRGYVYFTDSVVYENLDDENARLPVRIDVAEWKNYVPDGILFELDQSRGQTVRAAFEIEKTTFNRIVEKLRKAGQKSRHK